MLLAVLGTSGGPGLSHSPMCLLHPQHSPLYRSGAMIRPSPMAPPLCLAMPLSPLDQPDICSTGTAGCAPLAWGTQPVPDVRQRLGRHVAAETHVERRAGGMGVRPVPDSPLFSQGLHFQRSPWDSTPSPIPMRQGK